MSNINKNIIKQAGAAVANATNKAAGLSASTPEPGTVISVIQLVNGGRSIGPDAFVHFTESVRNKLLSLLVTLEPIQDFNGYDRPWPGGGGKNLVDMSSVTREYFIRAGNASADSPLGTPVHNASWSCSDYIAVEPSTQYTQTLPGYNSAGAAGLVFFSDKSVASAISGIPTTMQGSETYTFATPSNCHYVRISWQTSNEGSGSYPYPQLEKGAKTSYAPYSNICPITGRTGLSVYVGPTNAVGDASTYSMDWTSPAGTVYAGSADIVTGDIKAAPYYASYNGETLVGPWVSSMDVYDPEGTPTTGAQVVDLGGTMTEYHITGQDIITLVGDNYIWSDSGDVTITE